MSGLLPKDKDYVLYLASYEVKDLDNSLVIYKEYFEAKTTLICNKQLKTGARLLASAAII